MVLLSHRTLHPEYGSKPLGSFRDEEMTTRIHRCHSHVQHVDAAGFGKHVEDPIEEGNIEHFGRCVVEEVGHIGP